MEEHMDRFNLLARKMFDAALAGDVPSLYNLLQDDPLILDRCSIENSSHFTKSPLHVAVNLGHLDFTREIIHRKPELAEELDHSRRSPLHIASAKGHLEIVKLLLSINLYICLSCDQDGRNPVHVAASRGQVHVLDALLQATPQAALERTNSGESILHLCVKHRQLEALMFLINAMGDSELLNSKDPSGNTILHLAVAAKQPEMVKFLLNDKRMNKNSINANGLTAMDIHIQSRKDMNDRDIWLPLKRAKAQRAAKVLRPRNKQQTWLENARNALMVVASLIATMAFQVGINPPGGAWQDNIGGHNAGFSIMADVDKRNYDILLICNTVGLVSSLSVILLLISGLPCKRLFVGVLMITMWIAVTATTGTYMYSVSFLSSTNGFFSRTPSKNHHAVWLALQFSILVWLLLMVLLLLGHAMRLLIKLIRKLVRLVVRLCKGCFTMAAGRPPV